MLQVSIIQFAQRFRPLTLSIITAVLAFILVALISFFDHADNPVAHMEISFWEKVLLVCVVSPVVETIIFQKIVIDTAFKYTRNYGFSLIVSALLFALVHNYSFLYVAKMFVAGFLFGLLFIACKGDKPLLHVMLAHSFYNIIAVIMAVSTNQNF